MGHDMLDLHDTSEAANRFGGAMGTETQPKPYDEHVVATGCDMD